LNNRLRIVQQSCNNLNNPSKIV